MFEWETGSGYPQFAFFKFQGLEFVILTGMIAKYENIFHFLANKGGYPPLIHLNR